MCVMYVSGILSSLATLPYAPSVWSWVIAVKIMYSVLNVSKTRMSVFCSSTCFCCLRAEEGSCHRSSCIVTPKSSEESISQYVRATVCLSHIEKDSQSPSIPWSARDHFSTRDSKGRVWTWLRNTRLLYRARRHWRSENLFTKVESFPASWSRHVVFFESLVFIFIEVGF